MTPTKKDLAKTLRAMAVNMPEVINRWGELDPELQHEYTEQLEWILNRAANELDPE